MDSKASREAVGVLQPQPAASHKPAALWTARLQPALGEGVGCVSQQLFQENLDIVSGFSLVSTDSLTPVNTFSLVKLCQNSQLGIKDQTIGKKILGISYFAVASYCYVPYDKNSEEFRFLLPGQ